MLRRAIQSFVFPKHLVPHPGVARAYPNVEHHRLQTAQGAVEYFVVRSAMEGPLPVVFFAHGNGEVIDQWVLPLSRYQELGVHLVLVEYRGYGRSQGTPSERNVVADFLAIRQQVCERPDVDASRIIYHGRSIGGGVVCAAARQHAPSALILQSTFTDLFAIARRFLAVRILMLDHFESVQALTTLRCPVLIMHGRVDRLIPFAHAERLLEACTDGKLVEFPRADHNAPIDQEPSYWQAIAALLDRVAAAG